MSLKAGGVGINLTAASNAFLLVNKFYLQKHKNILILDIFILIFLTISFLRILGGIQQLKSRL